jgi:glycosyltransferase involved in cell wall biosynthesis
LWRALAASDVAPVKVWFLSDHGVRASQDAEFGQSFAWDIDLLSGYCHEFLPVEPGGSLRTFRGVALRQSFDELLERDEVTDLWVEGWRMKPLWDAVGAARRRGVRLWMRGESNDLRREPTWKWLAKRVVLGRHLHQVDQFLCIGAANRRLYRQYGVPAEKMLSAPYCVDNDRFARQSEELWLQRGALRRQWGIPDGAWCVLFCGKFIAKKRPADVIAAAQQLRSRWGDSRAIHLLFVGSGELGPALRAACRLVHGGESRPPGGSAGDGPTASFAGFLNQAEIARAYVAADVLAMPSDSGETWGLVVNEAMACGCPAVVSDQCGCAEDLPSKLDPTLVFRCGEPSDLARSLHRAAEACYSRDDVRRVADTHHPRHTVEAVAAAMQRPGFPRRTPSRPVA